MDEDKKPSIQEVLEGVRGGLSDDQLMSKFNLTPGELQGELQRLVDEGLITQAELTARASLFGETVKVSSPKGAEKRRSATGTSTTQSGDTDTAYCPNCRCDIATEPGQKFCSTCGGRLEKPEKDKYCPWEDGGNLGWPQALFQTINSCLFSTKTFFSELPSYGGYRMPLIFGILLASFGLIFYQVWEVVFQMGPMAHYVGRVVAMALIVFAPVIAVIFLPLGSLLLHACLMLVSEGSHKGFEATFRVCCYSTSAQICNVIPVLGSIANAIWGTYLLIIGVREVHKISTGRAALAVFLPWIVALCLLVMSLFVVFKSESHVNLGPTTIRQAASTPLGKDDDSKKSAVRIVTAASASEDSPLKEMMEPQNSGNPCEALKEYMARFIEIWQRSPGPKQCREDDFECQKEVYLEQQQKLLDTVQGTRSDALQKQVDHLKHRYEPILNKLPAVVPINLRAWEHSVIQCFDFKNYDDCAWLGEEENTAVLLRMCRQRGQ